MEIFQYVRDRFKLGEMRDVRLGNVIEQTIVDRARCAFAFLLSAEESRWRPVCVESTIAVSVGLLRQLSRNGQ